MNNNITNLSSIGFSNYRITESGIVYKIKPLEKQLNYSCHYKYYLIDDKGTPKRKTLKQLYKAAFNKEYSIDNIQSLPKEEWKEILNTNGKYYVSNCGRVKSYCGYNAIILKADTTENGYLVVKINNKNIRVHQLVANAFCENRYKGTKIKTEIHHKNRNRQDNRDENLLIVSITEHHKIHNKKEKKNNV